MKSKTTTFDTCICGVFVALVTSKKTGQPYPVEIGDTNIVESSDGEMSAVVDTTDFHHCGCYPGLADFVRRAVDRGARRLRMRLLTADDNPVALQWSERWRDYVYISDGEGREYATKYGRLELEHGGFRADMEIPADVRALLDAVSENPIEAAAAYGRATRECCFCSMDLTDERSIQVGYGPDCAKRWGLPWGDDGETSKKRAKRTRKAVGLG